MRVTGHEIFMESTRQYAQSTEVKQNISLSVTRQPPAAVADISTGNKAPEEAAVSSEAGFELSESDKRKIELIEKFIFHLTGKEVKFIIPKRVRVAAVNSEKQASPQTGTGTSVSGTFSRITEHYETEQTVFQAYGTVHLSDGRVIDFVHQLDLKREFQFRESLELQFGDRRKVDPLVINYGASSAVLSGNSVFFDLDGDGTPEEILFPENGSGFLSHDKNGDGIIGDGSELFGPISGNGFSDLSLHDMDNNGWIDEADDIFSELRIWSKDSDGNDILFALGQKDIGAICLMNTSTPFQLKRAGNVSDAELARTGIFLHENGMSGTVQHIDYLV